MAPSVVVHSHIALSKRLAKNHKNGKKELKIESFRIIFRIP